MNNCSSKQFYLKELDYVKTRIIVTNENMKEEFDSLLKCIDVMLETLSVKKNHNVLVYVTYFININRK